MSSIHNIAVSLATSYARVSIIGGGVSSVGGYAQQPTPSGKSPLQPDPIHRPTYQPDGETAVFMFPGVPIVVGAVQVFLGGLLQDSMGGDCTVALVDGNTQVTFGDPPGKGEWLLAFF